MTSAPEGVPPVARHRHRWVEGDSVVILEAVFKTRTCGCGEGQFLRSSYQFINVPCPWMSRHLAVEKREWELADV